MATKFISAFEIKRCERRAKALEEMLEQLRREKKAGGSGSHDVDERISETRQLLIDNNNHLARINHIKNGPKSGDVDSDVHYQAVVIAHLHALISDKWADVTAISGLSKEKEIRWSEIYDQTLALIDSAREYYANFEHPPIDKRQNKRNRITNILRHFSNLHQNLSAEVIAQGKKVEESND